MKFWWIHLRTIFRPYSYQRIGINHYSTIFWIGFERLILLFGLFGIDRLYYYILRLSAKSRRLRKDERQLAATIFKNSLNYDNIRIREGTRFGTFGGKVVYASIEIINSLEHLDPKTLIHELVHLWQYRKYGVAYIPRALAAQRTADAYDYGGTVFFQDLVKGRVSFHDLNYEQQASAIEDFYARLYLRDRILSGLGSGELWEVDKVIFHFLMGIEPEDDAEQSFSHPDDL